MDLGLQGKVVLITGGSQGIGRATALAFAREGARVAICARGREALEQAAAEVRAAGGDVFAEPADVTSVTDIERFVKRSVECFGGVDVLVNNAVSFSLGGVKEMPDEAWLQHFNVKLLAYVRCTKLVLPYMRQAGGGRIINIGGLAARVGGGTAGAMNAAIANFTKGLADEVAKDGILVNCVHPGATRTRRHEIVVERRMRLEGISREEAERRSIAAIPIGRLIEPADVANLIVFLASKQAGAITGQSIAVDGGAVRGVYY